ncbi:MAG: hypothetical protein GKR90_24605 [Pseudomonadales bacterium]|nr:hypothetical protein [Pseudomonadales bacterium]
METDQTLSRRERQVLEIVYAKQAATVADVQAELLARVDDGQVDDGRVDDGQLDDGRMSDGPSYAATRMVLQRLHKKGKLAASRNGNRHVYQAVTPVKEAGVHALQRLLDTFFAGSTTQAVSALLGSREQVSKEELDALERLIQQAKAAQE